jgi:hypothetical protein
MTQYVWSFPSATGDGTNITGLNWVCEKILDTGESTKSIGTVSFSPIHYQDFATKQYQDLCNLVFATVNQSQTESQL